MAGKGKPRARHPKIPDKCKPDSGSKKLAPPPPESVIKSPMDTQNYLVIHLPNGLKALLVSSCKHDPEVKNDRINPKTGVFIKVEEFDRKFVGIPDDDGTDVKPSNSSTCVGDKSKSDKNGNDDDEPERKKAKVAEDGKGNGGEMCRSALNSLVSFANVCLVVGAGTVHDPPDFPGMAHICEHACCSFGSKKYPEYMMLDKHIRNCGGDWSAYTASEYTGYYFGVNLSQLGVEGFQIAVDILADFVKDPLLPANPIQQEVLAVDSEASLRAPDDEVRLFQLLSLTTDPKHPYGGFDCGDFETLGKPTLHSRLIEWKNRHYAANYMTLVIQADLPLEKLEEIVHKSFDGLKSSSAPSPMDGLMKLHRNPFQTPEFTKFYKFVPVADVNMALLTWALPPNFQQNFKTKPLLYVSRYFLPDSSCSEYLRRNNLAHGIYTNDLQGWTSFCSIFTIFIFLTDAGIREIGRVIKVIFSTLKTILPNEQIFNDIRRVSAANFHYDPTIFDISQVISSSQILQSLQEPKYILTSQSLVTEFDPKIIKDCVSQLSPRKMNLIVGSKSFENECELVEKWHKTKYRVCDFNEKFLKECQNVKITDHEFKIPLEKNPYEIKSLICELLSDKDKSNGRPIVQTILNTKKANVQYLKENNCRPGYEPFGATVVTLESALSGKSETGPMFMFIWELMFFDRLIKEFYKAFGARMGVGIYMWDGVAICLLIGSPTHQTLLMKFILDNMMRFESLIDEQEFNDTRMYITRLLKNIELNPHYFALDLGYFLMGLKGILLEQRRAMLSRVDFQDFKNFLRDFKDRMKIGAWVIGCIAKVKAQNLADYILSMTYRESPEIRSLPVCPRAMQLPLGEHCLRVKSQSDQYNFSAVMNRYQFSILKSSELIILQKLARVMGSAAFDQLRDKEHLSYAIYTVTHELHGPSSLYIIVIPQPHRHSTDYVDERIDAFLAKFRKTIESYKTFLCHYSSKSCATITKEDHEKMILMYDNVLLPTGKDFRKLSIQVVGTPEESKRKCKPVEAVGIQKKINKYPRTRSFNTSKLKIKYLPEDSEGENGYFIRNIESFKNSLWVFPCSEELDLE